MQDASVDPAVDAHPSVEPAADAFLADAGIDSPVDAAPNDAPSEDVDAHYASFHCISGERCVEYHSPPATPTCYEPLDGPCDPPPDGVNDICVDGPGIWVYYYEPLLYVDGGPEAGINFGQAPPPGCRHP
jgi:hypothetical protein